MDRDYLVSFLDYLRSREQSYTYVYVAKGVSGFYQGIGKTLRNVNPTIGDYALVRGCTHSLVGEDLCNTGPFICVRYDIKERKDVTHHVVYGGDDCCIIAKVPQAFMDCNVDFKLVRDFNVICMAPYGYRFTEMDLQLIQYVSRGVPFVCAGRSRTAGLVQIGNCEYEANINITNQKYFVFREDVGYFVPFQDLVECKRHRIYVVNGVIVNVQPSYKNKLQIIDNVGSGTYDVLLPNLRKLTQYPVLLSASDLVRCGDVSDLVEQVLKEAPDNIEHTVEGALRYTVEHIIPSMKRIQRGV